MNDQHRVADCSHRELAIGWALHALEPDEESLVAAHMPECPTCTSTAAETEEVGAMLGLSVPEAIPSAELEQRVLSATGARWAAPVVPLAPSTPPARHITTPSRLRTRELLVAAAVILLAAAVVLGVRVVQLNGQLNQAQRQVTGDVRGDTKRCGPGGGPRASVRQGRWCGGGHGAREPGPGRCGGHPLTKQPGARPDLRSVGAYWWSAHCVGRIRCSVAGTPAARCTLCHGNGEVHRLRGIPGTWSARPRGTD